LKAIFCSIGISSRNTYRKENTIGYWRLFFCSFFW